MEKTTESGTGIEETGNNNYLQLFFYRAPKKNHDAIAKNLKQFVPWFKKHGVGIEYYQLGKSETQAAIDSAKKSGMDIMDSIVKTLSTTAEEDDEEEVWIEQQYFRDHKHCEDVYAKMMQDKSIEQPGNEFFGLITQGKKLITGGFHRLRV
jgi:large subunit ribosomal protein L17